MPDKTFSDLASDLRALPGRLDKNLRGALLIATQEAANEAKTTHRYEDRTGALTNSIEPDGPHGSFLGGDLSATLSAGAPHAVFVAKGTRPHEIKPKHRRFLRFPIEGGFRFAKRVMHPGTKPDPFLEDAVESALPKLTDEMIPDAVELSFLQAGFRP